MQSVAQIRNQGRQTGLQGRTGGIRTLPRSKGGSAWGNCFLRSPQHGPGFSCAFYSCLLLTEIPGCSRAGRWQPPDWALQALTEPLAWLQFISLLCRFQDGAPRHQAEGDRGLSIYRGGMYSLPYRLSPRGLLRCSGCSSPVISLIPCAAGRLHLEVPPA